ncbi:MAG: hypothetical protein RLZZ142_2082 [Verrucomicrobiota bacterium]|jgi:Zn-dependent protease
MIGLAVFQFGAKLKLLLGLFPKVLVILKSGGSMVFTIAVYGAFWGWKYALGFVLLLLVHECGHLVAARQFGLNASAPVFIPFMGAFILLRDQPQNAWVEAWVGIGGPLLGAAAAAFCHGLGVWWHQPLLIALAWTGYWLNLFNLIPVGQLDGGRIVTAISPWLWVPGVGILGWLLWRQPQHLILWLVFLSALPRLFSLFRRRTGEWAVEMTRFYEISSLQRWTMAALYFALIGVLVVGMQRTERHPKPSRALYSGVSEGPL